MARFRNTSRERRWVVELGRTVEVDELFTVPDGRADAFDRQPYFTRDEPEPRRRKADKTGDDS